MGERRNLREGEDVNAYLMDQFGQEGLQLDWDPNNPTPEQSANMLDAIYYGAYTADGQSQIANGDLSGVQNVAQNGLAPTQGPGQYNQFEGGYIDDTGQYHLGPSQWEHDSAWANTTSYDELMEAGNPNNARTWVKQQYMAGNLTAEEAQELENKAFEEQYGSLSYSYEVDTYGDNNTLSEIGYIQNTLTPTDYSTLSQDPANWSRSTGNSNVERVTTSNIGEGLFNAIMTGALTAGAGGALIGAGMVPGSTALGAAKGAVGGLASGAIQGDISLGEIARGAITGGAFAAGSDYLRDTLDGISSDVGGLFGEGGLIGGDKISTEGFNDFLFGSQGAAEVFDSAGNFIGYADDINKNFPVWTGVTELGWTVNEVGTEGLFNNGLINAITPILNNDLVQDGLDLITPAFMDGYDEKWKEHYELQDVTDANGNVIGRVWEFDFANASEQDIDNYNRFMAAQQTGMWRLDEQYTFTDTPRSEDSNMVGILTRPIEAGGNPYTPPSNPSNGPEEDSGDGEGSGQGSGSGGSNGLLSGGSGSSGEAVAGGSDGVGGNGSLPVNRENTFLTDLILAYEAETDPIQKQYLKDQIEYYSEDALVNGSDQTLPPASDQTLPVYDSDVLLPNTTDDQLPSSGGGAAAVAGLLGGGGSRTEEDPEWGPLYKYMKVSKWQRAREKLYEDMAKGMLS